MAELLERLNRPGAAATGLAASIVADIVTRVTKVEIGQDDLQRRVPPPV